MLNIFKQSVFPSGKTVNCKPLELKHYQKFAGICLMFKKMDNERPKNPLDEKLFS